MAVWKKVIHEYKIGNWHDLRKIFLEDNLQIMAKSQKMTYLEWPNPGRWLAKIGQILVYNSQNLKIGVDETSSLKPS